MALYRKWRSQTFGEVIGQEHVVQTLRHAILHDRVAHAYLFTGPRGVGKTSMARLLAKAVNCTAPLAERPCGECESCIAISEGRAVDVIEMDAASHTSVEDAREIIERVQFRPTTGRKKVYVIDEVHMLSTAAFNALLKTLEEPPDHAIFILATTENHKVPATILSRCQRFTFMRHTVAATANHIQQIAIQEEVSLESGVAEAIARAATGSMRDALGVLEQLISFSSGAITLKQVQSLLGMSSEAEIAALIEALVQANLADALRAVNGVAEQGVDMRQFTRDLVERLRALLLLVATESRSRPDASEDELVVLERWAEQLRVEQIKHWVQVFSMLDYQLRTSPYGHLPLELAVIEALIGPSRSADSPPSPPPPPRSGPPSRPFPDPPVPVRTIPDPVSSHPAPAPVSSNPVAVPPPVPVAPAPSRMDESDEPATPDPAAPEQPARLRKKTADAPAPPTVSEPARVIPFPTPPAPSSPPVPAGDTLLERVEEVWPMVLLDMRPKDPTVQALLRDVQPYDTEDHTVVLLAKSSFHQKNIEARRNRIMVEELLSKYLGIPVAIRCTIEQQSSKTPARNKIQEIRKDPMVRAAINIFSADVVEVKEEE